jgi:hydrogenase nickel incorporation protein HypB
MSQSRLIRLEADILGKNARYAAANRDRFTAQGILALNLVSSPGSGKTTLLCRTLEAIGAEFPVAVIEGDQQTSADADRIRATGAPAIQINTGKGCHLDGHMVGHALDHLAPPRAACCSSRMSAIWCARRPSIWARARAWRSFR